MLMVYVDLLDAAEVALVDVDLLVDIKYNILYILLLLLKIEEKRKKKEELFFLL